MGTQKEEKPIESDSEEVVHSLASQRSVQGSTRSLPPAPLFLALQENAASEVGSDDTIPIYIPGPEDGLEHVETAPQAHQVEGDFDRFSSRSSSFDTNSSNPDILENLLDLLVESDSDHEVAGFLQNPDIDDQQDVQLEKQFKATTTPVSNEAMLISTPSYRFPRTLPPSPLPLAEPSKNATRGAATRKISQHTSEPEFAAPPQAAQEESIQSPSQAPCVLRAVGKDQPEDDEHQVQGDSNTGRWNSSTSLLADTTTNRRRGAIAVKSELMSGFEKGLRSLPIQKLVCGCCCVFCAIVCMGAVFGSFVLLPTLNINATPGAFAYPAQVELTSVALQASFQEVQRTAVDLSSIVASNVSYNAGPESNYIWRHIELIFTMAPWSPANVATDDAQGILSNAHLPDLKRAEDKLRQLPSWQRMCKLAPKESRHLCSPGDSIIAVAFASIQAATPEKQGEGILNNVSFDALGNSLLFPVETMLSFLYETQPESVKRWLPSSSYSSQGLIARSAGGERNLVRSLFLFKLPPEAAGTWKTFVKQDLEPQLIEMQDVTSGVQVFFKVDGLDNTQFGRTMGLTRLMTLAAFCAFAGTLVATRRVLLSISAFFLCFATSVIGASANSKVPGSSVLAWFFCAALTAETASCCSSTFGEGRLWRNVIDEVKSRAEELRINTDPKIALKVVQLALPPLALAPLFTSGCALLAASSAAQLVPMVGEFAQTAGICIFILLVLSPVFLLPATLASDAAAEYVQRHCALEVPTGLVVYALPFELTYKTDATGQKQRQKRSIAVRATRLLSFWTAFALLILVIATSTIALVATRSTLFKFDYTTPQLFELGNAFEEDKQAHKLFPAYNSPRSVEETSVLDALSCNLSATTSQCAWQTCQAASTTNSKTGSCDCDYIKDTTKSCQPSARFAGIQLMPRQFATDVFWPWVKEQIPALNFDTTKQVTSDRLDDVFVQSGDGALWKHDIPLEIQDWSSGEMQLQPQYSSSTGMTSSDCYRFSCYCSRKRCEQPSNWTHLGNVYFFNSKASNSNGARRLQSTGSTVDISIIWGNSGSASLAGSLEVNFPSQLRLDDPQVQRDLLAFCEGTPPYLQIVSRQCFAVDFRNWLVSTGRQYPVPSQNFSSRILEFFNFHQEQQLLQFTPLPKYFWSSSSGSNGFAGTVAVFKVPKPLTAQDELSLKQRWQRYVSERSSRSSPGSASLVTPSSDDAASATSVFRDSANAGVTTAIIVVFILGFLATFSFSLSLAVLAGIGSCMLIYVAVLKISEGLFDQPTVDILDVLSMVVFILGTVSPLLRMALFYVSANDGPVLAPAAKASAPEKKKERRPSVSAPSLEIIDNSFWLQTFSAEERSRTLQHDTILSPKKVDEPRYENMAEDQDFSVELRTDDQGSAEKDDSKVESGIVELRRTFRASSMLSERKARIATSLSFAVEPVLSFALANVFSGLILSTSVAPLAVSKVGKMFFAAAVVQPVLSLLVLPILFLNGLSPSRVWLKALWSFVRYTQGTVVEGASEELTSNLRNQQDLDEELQLSSKVLGWPFSSYASSILTKRQYKSSSGHAVLPTTKPKKPKKKVNSSGTKSSKQKHQSSPTTVMRFLSLRTLNVD